MNDSSKGSQYLNHIGYFVMESYAKLLICLRDQNLEFILNKENMTIGRGINQSIVINEPTISRLHARIFIRDKSYFLEDLSTFQKTYLNKAPMQIPMNLKHKDIIQLGNVKGIFLVETLSPSEESILDQVRYSFQGSYKDGDGDGDGDHEKSVDEKVTSANSSQNLESKVTPSQNLDSNEKIKKATMYLKADIDEVLVDEEEVEVPDSPLATGESLDMPFSEIPFANVVTYAKSDSSVKSKVIDAQLVCENTKQILTINKEAVYIGFDSINEMQISDPYFSKVHFAVMFNKKSSKYHLKNMGDKEVRSNGVPIENMEELAHYSIIQTGKYRFHFFSGFQEVVDLQKSMQRENETLAIRFFPELPGETVIIDSSALQIRGEYKVVGSPNSLSSTIFFTKNSDGCKYILIGEVSADKEELPSSSIEPYIIKLQGIFETIIDYENVPLQIMKDFNQVVYSKFKSLTIFSTIIMLHRDDIIWVGDGLCAPIINTREGTLIKASKGMPLGVYDSFLGYEQQISWKNGDKVLFFTHSILNSCLKNQTLFVSMDSLKRLFSKKLEENTVFSLDIFLEDLITKVQLDHPVLFTLLTRENS